MTWSILGRDEHGRFGAAVASRFFAVGALCMHTRRGAGCLSTQALINPLYGPAGLDLLGVVVPRRDANCALVIPRAVRTRRIQLISRDSARRRVANWPSCSSSCCNLNSLILLFICYPCVFDI